MKTVEISGKSIPVHFGSYTLGQFCRERGLSVTDLGALGERLDLLGLYELGFSGVRAGFVKQGQPCPYDLEGFCELLDTESGSIEKIMNVFSESMQSPDSGNAKRMGASKK